MPRMCGLCKNYDAEGALTTCPACNAPMQFTLLPPPGQHAQPLTLPEPDLSAGVRRRTTADKVSASFALFDAVFRYRKLAGLVVVPLVLVCSLFGVQLSTNESLKSRYDRVQVGMEVDQVERILRPPVRYRGRTMPQHQLLDGVPDEGPYTLNYSEAGAGSITLRFQDGVLVDKAQQGMK